MEYVYEVCGGNIVLNDKELGLSITTPIEPALDAAYLHDKGYEICTKKIRSDMHDEWVCRKGVRSGQYRRIGKRGAVFEAYYKDGYLHGPSSMFYDTGSKASVAWYIEGKKWGKVYTFFRDGKVESIHSYKQGQLYGKQRFYYENGVMKSLLFYEEGLLEGRAAFYFENGNLRREVDFCKGERNGADCSWSRDGIILFAIEYSHGKEVRVSIPDPVVTLYQILR